jgi:hypothetical protein
VYKKKTYYLYVGCKKFNETIYICFKNYNIPEKRFAAPVLYDKHNLNVK